MRLLISAAALCCSALAAADPGASFQQGKRLGEGAGPAIFSGIGSGAVADKVPAFGSSPTEAQLFQGGQGQLVGHGVSKIQSCRNYTPGPNKVANQECEAVNFLARNPQVRSQFNVTNNDPMIVGAKTARNNAENYFRAAGISGGTGSSSQCTTRTETTPPQYSTETCSLVREFGLQQCTMGRKIVIDSDANFQCEQTISAYENLKCRRGNSVTIGYGRCTPGQLLTTISRNNCPRCIDPFIVTEVSCGQAGTNYSFFTYTSRNGDRSGLYQIFGTSSIEVSPNSSFRDRFIGDYGRNCRFPLYYSQTCGATTCVPEVALIGSTCNGQDFRAQGSPIMLPLNKTISNWVSDQCLALQARTR